MELELIEKLDRSETSGTDDHATPVRWNQINWKKAHREVQRLRYRIFQATTQKNWREVKNLSKLMLRSYSNLLVSTRQVTQINKGKNTPGIDGEIADTTDARGQLVAELCNYQPWKAKPVKRVYIPKANGKKRPLGIPTLRDRVMQAIVKNALEPRFEAEFEANSYGFRPGRCCQDATVAIHTALNEGVGGRNHWILDADIRGAFDHISHAYVLERIGPMPGRKLVKQWLQAGYVEWGKLHQTTEGTPQGGVVSPLLANIALDGMQLFLGNAYRIVRYADDFVVMAKNREAIEQAIPKITAWLKIRGLELNQEKTHVVNRTQGFCFLGFETKLYGRTLLIRPQKEKVNGFLVRVKDHLKQYRTATTEEVIRTLNPILRGWANYYRYAASKETFQTVSHRLWQMSWNWARRRHPNKSKRWIYRRYFKSSPYGAKLCAEIKNRTGKKTELHLVGIAEIPILSHVKVRGTSSPDDPKLAQYWEQRRMGQGRKRLAKGGSLYRIAERQGWKCLGCNQPLFNGEPLDLHHVVPIAKGGTNHELNKQWLHEGCHYQQHGRAVA